VLTGFRLQARRADGRSGFRLLIFCKPILHSTLTPSGSGGGPPPSEPIAHERKNPMCRGIPSPSRIDQNEWHAYVMAPCEIAGSSSSNRVIAASRPGPPSSPQSNAQRRSSAVLRPPRIVFDCQEPVISCFRLDWGISYQLTRRLRHHRLDGSAEVLTWNTAMDSQPKSTRLIVPRCGT
jgi:hypothetical protein